MYSAYIRLENQCILRVVGDYLTREAATEAMEHAYKNFVRFPGGTQSIAAWVEKD